MLSEQKVCKWITDKVEEGRGAVIFSLEENDGMVGVWVGDPEEHERALGYGDDVVSAVLDAIGKEAVEHSVHPTLLTEHVNYCNPVNGVHAPFCTGHKSQSG